MHKKKILRVSKLCFPLFHSVISVFGSLSSIAFFCLLYYLMLFCVWSMENNWLNMCAKWKTQKQQQQNQIPCKMPEYRRESHKKWIHFAFVNEIYSTAERWAERKVLRRKYWKKLEVYVSFFIVSMYLWSQAVASVWVLYRVCVCAYAGFYVEAQSKSHLL